jgi:hypothetical protein
METAEDKKHRKTRGLSGSEGKMISDVVVLQRATRSTWPKPERNREPIANPAAAARKGRRGKSLEVAATSSTAALGEPVNILGSAT